MKVTLLPEQSLTLFKEKQQNPTFNNAKVTIPAPNKKLAVIANKEGKYDFPPQQ
jgi:hypothetical protein